MALKRIAKMCRVCPNVYACDHKRMECVGYLEMANVAEAVAAPLVEDMAAPLTVKHDYRDIKIAEGMTVTIDLEDLKRRMVEDFYRSVGLGSCAI